MTTADPIARYAATKDAEAFAALVQEYQSMVLATCRRQARSSVRGTLVRTAVAAKT